MKHASMAIVIFLATQMPAQSGNWPAWRGPNADGIADEKGLPFVWSAEKNVRWKVAMPEAGNSTPIVWDNHVFITQAFDGGKRRALIAFRRSDGEKLWLQEVPCETMETTHRQNPPCSGSPTTDGEAVYAHFASGGVAAYDFKGKKLWSRDFGPVLHKWGNGSSPILYKNLLIVYQGPGVPTFLTALDKRTGETVWTAKETSINSPIFGSWSTPVVVRVNGQDELIMPLPGDRIGGEGLFKGYDPATGKELWQCFGLGTEVYAMPIVSPAADIVVGICGHNGPTMAVRPGGRGDVTKTHRLWRHADKLPQRVGSGIIHNGHLFLADAPGFVECLRADTGEAVWKERLDGNVWGSMLLADGRLYVSNLEGQTFVLAASPKFNLLATNELKEPIYAAPVASNGDLFIRTWKNLYCIADKR